MKLVISNKIKTGKFTNVVKLNNTLKQLMDQKIVSETRKYFEINKNKNMAY